MQLTTTFVSLLVAITAVNAAYVPEPELEARNPAARVAGRLARTGLNAAKTAPRVAAPRIAAPAARIAPQAAPKSAVNAKSVGAGMAMGKMFGGKIIGGATVGFGALGAQAADNKKRDFEDELGLEARGWDDEYDLDARDFYDEYDFEARGWDDEFDMEARYFDDELDMEARYFDDELDMEARYFDDEFDLEARNPIAGAVRGAARQGARQMTRVARPQAVVRPQTIARPAARIATPPAKAPSTIMSKLKTGGTVTAVGLTAGAGEYAGGNKMSDMIDKLNAHKRSFDDDEFYSLVARNPAALRAGARKIAQSGVRAAARTGGGVAHAAPRVAHQAPAAGVKTVAKKVGTAGLVGTAAYTGGFAEGMIQNIDVDTQKKLAANPKGTIAKMVGANNAFHKRYLDDEDME